LPESFSVCIQSRPDKANEISVLMITGVFGGAVIPFCMGLMADSFGSQVGAVIVIQASTLYLMFAAFAIKVQPKLTFAKKVIPIEEI